MSTTSTTTATTSLISLDALFENPVFAGGVGLAGLGTAAAIARRSVIRGAGLIQRRLLVNLEISKQDPSYQWILSWLTLPRPQSGFLTARITRVHDLAVNTAGPDPSKARGLMQPGYGKYIIRHRNAFIMVEREKQSSSNMTTGEPHETITLRTLYAHRQIFEDIFKEAQELAATAHEGKTVMWTFSGQEWRKFGLPRRKRPLSSVILDRGVKERIIEDVEDFLNRQQWYVDRGIPYRRGYLLYGPPGSGKSSFIQALAGAFDFGVSIINMSERGMTDDKLASCLTKLPPRTILLLEDADAAFVNRRQRDADGYAGATVTFSGLLNALDGVAAGEERIAFLTTNHIDMLDEALIRPGRVDMAVRIGEATRYQAAEMWDRFYGDIDVDHKGRVRFLAKLEELGIITREDGTINKPKIHTSAAAMQGLFLFNKDNMEGAITMAEGLIPRIYEPEEAPNGITVPA
ncbi:Complex III assembly protein translocase and chaperone [Clarireedia jacksonii]